MLPVPGHLACSLILYRCFRLNLFIVVLAAFLPDIIDKPLRYVFHVFPFGRNIMHNIPGVFLISLIVFVCLGRKKALSWGIGHLGHILSDAFESIIAGNKFLIPWLWPFVSYDFSIWSEHTLANFEFNIHLFIIESLLFVLSILLIWPQRKIIKDELLCILRIRRN